jgi:hypothetical protein
MKIFHEYGTKDKLFEMMIKVNRLNEDLLSKNRKNEIIKDFVEYCYNFLGMEGEPEGIEISYDPTEAAEMRSFGKHTPADGIIRVVATNRNLADILRTLAHEIVHRKQLEDGKLYLGAGTDGSEIENEANAKAAVIMRKYGKDNPIIFE